MTEPQTGADLFVSALERYGVTHLFGNPGTTELPITRALPDSGIEYVLGLHEDVAVGMAGGYASTRRYHAHHDPSITPLGVVNLHVAPGVAHGLGNLQNAEWGGVPLLVTAGNHARSFRHQEPILSGDLERMTEEYTKFSAEVEDVEALATMVRRAVRVALTPPTGPVFLGLPMDVMDAETDATPERLGAIPNAGAGDPDEIERAADYLLEADEAVIVLGDHVARSGVDAIGAAARLAEASGAPVYSEMLSSEINFPPDHDQWVAFLPPSVDVAEAVFDADALLFVGCSSNAMYIPYEGQLVPHDPAIVQVSDDAWEVGKNDPADAAVIGDPGLVMDRLADLLEERLPADRRRARREAIAPRKAWAREHIDVGRPDVDDPRASKAELADAIRAVAPDAFVINESNTSKYPLITRFGFGPEGFLANKNGGLGYGLPATVGAAVATRELREDRARGRDLPEPRPVVGFIGDGSYLYYPQALYSAVREDLDLAVVVADNRNYRILKDGMLDIYGGTDEDYEYVGMDIDPPFDIPANAQSNGASGTLVEDPADLEGAISEAVAADGPAVVDALVHDR